MGEQSQQIQLSKVLTDGWKWILTAAAIGAVLGAVVGLVWPKVYEATAVMTLEQPGETLNMETERLNASSAAVMAIAAEELGVSVGEVRESTTVQVPRGALALEFLAVRSTPEEAAEFANAMAEALMTYTVSGQTASSQNRVTLLEERIETLESELAEADPESRRAEVLAENLTEAEGELVEVELGLEDSRPSYATLVSPAQPPSSPTLPGVPVFAAGGLFAGGLLGMCVVMLWFRRSPNTAGTSQAAPAVEEPLAPATRATPPRGADTSREAIADDGQGHRSQSVSDQASHNTSDQTGSDHHDQSAQDEADQAGDGSDQTDGGDEDRNSADDDDSAQDHKRDENE